MMARRFGHVWKKLKKATKDKFGVIHVYLTPKGATSHTKVGIMDHKHSVIVIPNSTEMYIPVERAALERAIPTDNEECSVQVKNADALTAMQFYDVMIGKEPKLKKRWLEMLPTGLGLVTPNLRRMMKNPPISKREKEMSEMMRKMEIELNKAKRRLNQDAGALIELQIAGLLPMKGKPPIPLKNIHRIHFGSDWLSLAWKGDVLHRYWIESNLSRTGDYPTFTKNGEKVFEAARADKIKDHYMHHWIDEEGEIHWQDMAKERKTNLGSDGIVF